MKLSEAQRLAVSLMREHGLAQMGWTFGWDRARRRLGACHHDKRLISLSVPLTIDDTDDARVRNTILHEIAHALVGAEHGHDYIWRRKAREIGCNAEECGKGGTRLPFRYIGQCPTCGYEAHRDRRAAKRLYHLPCMKTLGEVDAVVIQWRRA